LYNSIPQNLSIIINECLYSRNTQKEELAWHFLTHTDKYEIRLTENDACFCSICDFYCGHEDRCSKIDDRTTIICQECVRNMDYVTFQPRKNGKYISDADNRILFLWYNNQLLCFKTFREHICYLKFSVHSSTVMCLNCGIDTNNIREWYGGVCDSCIKKSVIIRWNEAKNYLFLFEKGLVADVVYNIILTILSCKQKMFRKTGKKSGTLKLGWKRK